MSILSEIYRYAALHLRSFEHYADKYLQKSDNEKADMTVSLSTIPGRIENIYPALNSLMDQTMPPRRICLAIPPFSIREQKAYIIPARLAHCPAIEIIDARKDWGPATKLIPALLHPSTRPDDIILTTDDDNIYPAQFVEAFWKYSKMLPEAALSLRGAPMSRTLRWKDCHAFKGTAISKPASVEIITGCGGILVKPKFFTADFFNYENAPAAAFFVDDIWTSGNLAKRNIPRYVIPFTGSYVYLTTLTTLSGPALDHGENKGGGNDDTVMDYFRPYWKLPPE
ncbi:MAG: hypothetical protein CVU71_01760 [Deltaproteobacteria bacterium HGW-Deltaproteobacteria-6]|jgi:hypothetical protein|nr:MAG: hypothetical protein CVU71_01760 [Deltaproteobacteria bacterium HGW-Deltaproteobacteria-6]